MGWSYTYKPKGESILSFLRKEFEYKDGPREVKILDCAVVRLREAYLACQNTLSTGESYTFGLVCLLGYDHNSHYNFGYKSMSEDMGPYTCDCPERIMRLLTPLNSYPESARSSSDAQKWRDECWRRINEKKSRPKVKEGDIVRFKTPLHFTNGATLDTFRCVSAKRGRFSGEGQPGAARLYHIRGWRNLAYEVLPELVQGEVSNG